MEFASPQTKVYLEVRGRGACIDGEKVEPEFLLLGKKLSVVGTFLLDGEYLLVGC